MVNSRPPGRTLEETDHQHPDIGAVGEHRRSDARRRRSRSVESSCVAVDAEQGGRRCCFYRTTVRRVGRSATTLKLRLVRPPYSSSPTRTSADRRGDLVEERVERRVRLEVLEGLGHGRVDRVLGAGEPVLRRDVPPDPTAASSVPPVTIGA